MMTTPPMAIEPLNPFSPAALALMAQSDAYMAALYPAESNHMADPRAMAQPHVLYLGCWLDNELAACGAVRVNTDEDGSRYGEIKRLFVAPQHRGKGLSKALMRRLHAHLQGQGIHLARLETGVRQPEAIALYQGLGYARRGPFGGYAIDPLSLFMEAKLPAT
jgi:putative acetyltransferase